MPLYVCEICGCIDNTALGHAYHPKVDEKGELVRDEEGRIVFDRRCTECKTGVWHAKFPKEKYDPNKHNVINKP